MEVYRCKGVVQAYGSTTAVQGCRSTIRLQMYRYSTSVQGNRKFTFVELVLE
jgi:hypothetical protein